MKSLIAQTVRSLEEIPNPSALVSLQFTNRSLHDLPSLSAFKNLTELDLSGNCFAHGLLSLQALKYLRRLNLAENGIEEAWELPSTIEQLSLAGNMLRELNCNILQLTKLNTLDISRNLIVSILPLRSLTSLRCLYASCNSLTSIEGIAHLTNLIELDVSSNPIESETDLSALELNQSISVVILKDTPYYKKTKNIFDSFREGAFDLDHFEDGIFYRNLDRLKDLKSSRFKRKLRNLKSLMADPDSPDWGSSKRSSCVQSACQSSRHEESFSKEEMKLPVVRLELPFLQRDSSRNEELDSVDQFTQLRRYKPHSSHYSQLSVEETTPWRSANIDLERSKEQITSLQSKIQTLEEQLQVKPDNQLEVLFDDLVAYCLPDEHNPDISFSPVRYSRAVEKIKAIVDERNELHEANELLRMSQDRCKLSQERLRMRLADYESWSFQHSCEIVLKYKREDFEAEMTEKMDSLHRHLNSMMLENEGLRAELNESTKAMIDKLRELEAENDRLRVRSRDTNRSMNSSQVESSMLDISYARRLPEEGKYLIDKKVGQYVLSLKEKISRLTTKLHALREQRNEYRAKLLQYRLAMPSN
mmetsp:Transcript_21902/g.39951  ORF Transcript_21902/g.39951 Transcript_21902/m.39951 type:complete len:589 (-) Transcript_21902:27-1793(-)